MSGILASYEYLDATLEALGNLRDQGYTDITAYSPLPEHNIEHALGYDQSPVRVFTLVGGLTGAAHRENYNTGRGDLRSNICRNGRIPGFVRF